MTRRGRSLRALLGIAGAWGFVACTLIYPTDELGAGSAGGADASNVDAADASGDDVDAAEGGNDSDAAASCDGCAPNSKCFEGMCGGSAVIDVAAGWTSACVLLAAGSVWCWGANDSGQLGVPPTSVASCADGTSCRATPAEVPGLSGVTQISVGARVACALTEGGDAYCWGDNAAGELGRAPGSGGDIQCGTAWCSPTPVKIPAPPLEQIVAGAQSVCARTKSGAVLCWGDGQWFENGLNVNTSTPTQVAGLPTDIVDLAVSIQYPHACAVSSAQHEVYCWGINLQGELGHAPFAGSPADITAPVGEYPGNPVPQVVAGLPAVDSVIAPLQLSCALDQASGSAWCWGGNADGSLGNGSAPDAMWHPTSGAMVSMPPIAILGARQTRCALSKAHEVYCWGDSSELGQIGTGSVDGVDQGAVAVECCGPTACFPTPQKVPSFQATKLSAGQSFVLALSVDGKVYGWGRNTHGEAGHSPPTQGDVAGYMGVVCNPSPTPVIGLP